MNRQALSRFSGVTSKMDITISHMSLQWVAKARGGSREQLTTEQLTMSSQKNSPTTRSICTEVTPALPRPDRLTEAPANTRDPP